MAELNFPDFLGTAQRGYAVGAGMRDDRRQQQDQAQIRALAPQIVGGDLAAYQQAAAVDPAAAQQLQGAGDVTFKRLAGAYKLVDDARKSGDIRAVNAALKQTAPFFSQVLGKPVPTEWAVNDPAWEEGWGKLGQQIAMAQTGSGTQGRVQSTYVDGDGQRVAIMADGTQKVLGANDSGMSQQTISITGADGRPRQFTFDKRTGNYVPADQGGQSSALGAPAPAATGPAAGLPSVPGGDPQAIQQAYQSLGAKHGFEITSMQRPVLAGVGAGVNSQHPSGTAVDYRTIGKTPQQIAALRADLEANGFEVIDESDGKTGTGPHLHAELPPGNRPAASPSAFVGRSPEQDAEAVARAKGGVELELLPEAERIKRDSAIQQAVGIETGKTAAEKAVAAPALISTLQNSLDSIDELLASPGLSGIVGLGSMNPINKIPGTDARGLIARADQIAGQSFLAAFNQLKGGGAITEREGQAATQAIARLDRSQSEKDYRQALSDLRDAISPAIERARQQAAGGMGQPQGRQIKRTGTLNGRKVVQYSDGTTEYAD